MSPGIVWTCDPLTALTPLALYRVLRARQAVFVFEQRCAYLDADGLDERCRHLAGWLRDPMLADAADPGLAVAYARLVPPHVRYAEASIGRVLTIGAGRGVGLGRELMRRAMEVCAERWPGTGLRISAQAHLQSFYETLGFEAQGQPYDEDGIAHIEMVRPDAGAAG